ncbi:MAG TPA: ribonuclease III [Candidatus Eremiobacteraeota bacterium]|nr:MAG: Ribonuclease 3 [bacterium ADurb.Bin363]HPZ07323.1 ribonuclease III [Candidatus Eremiobacteraeota bacterium]
MGKKRTSSIKKLETIIGYKFKEQSILENALTHESYVHEVRGYSLNHYEQLEFLGDAVLGLAVCHILFKKYRKKSEGWLAKAKALIVSKDIIIKKALKINLGLYLRLGRGELKSGGKNRPSILTDSFEALIGAMFLDGGYEICKNFIAIQFKEELINVKKEEFLDFKTLLQELSQSHFNTLPIYEVMEEIGPEHEKIFHIIVKINNIVMEEGFGKTKKEAGQIAARKAVEKLKNNFKKS